jgi:hypothetical protein
MKKSVKFFAGSMLLAFALSFIPQDSDALCINCGCHKLRKALSADGTFDKDDAEAVAECHGGFVLKIQL